MDARGVNCGESSPDLLARFRDELSPSEAESLDTHLAACSVCQEEDRGIRALAAALDDLPTIEPSTDSWSRMKVMLEEDVPAPVVRRGVLLFLKPAVLLPAALAAAALLLVFLLPSSPAATLTAEAGDISVDGTDLAAGSGAMDLGAGAVIASATLSRIGLAASRETSITLAPGTRLEVQDPRTLRLLSGRILARVEKGTDPICFSAAGGTVAVTGTVFDLLVDDGADQATVTVIEGEVEVSRAGREPARVIRGQAYTITGGPGSMSPVPADPWRVRDWCSAPTPLLTLTDRRLKLTLSNENVSPLRLKPFDPAAASYYLHFEGPSGRMDVKVQEGMILSGGRRAGEREVRTLMPGDAAELTIDLEQIDLRSLGVSSGTYQVTVGYRPYPPLPADAWRGRLEAGPVTLRVE